MSRRREEAKATKLLQEKFGPGPEFKPGPIIVNGDFVEYGGHRDFQAEAYREALRRYLNEPPKFYFSDCEFLNNKVITPNQRNHEKMEPEWRVAETKINGFYVSTVKLLNAINGRGYETMVFPAAPDDTVESWGELYSHRSETRDAAYYSHDEAVKWAETHEHGKCPHCEDRVVLPEHDYTLADFDHIVPCEDCGEHPADPCPNCEELIDRVFWP